MKACLLTIGDEITAGEIQDKNAPWLARELFLSGVETRLQLSVRDNIEDIVTSLKFAADSCELIFVTGGLGPTSDDLTRDAVAKWLGVELVKDANALARIVDKLTSRSVTLREGHQRQAMFPQAAEIYPNNAGTADAFYVNKNQIFVFVLPGPPRELQPIYKFYVEPWLKKLNIKDRRQLFYWKCEGKESELANIAEEIFAGKGYQLGYRANHPICIIKLWVFEKDIRQVLPLISQWEDRISDCLMQKGQGPVPER